MAVQVEYVFSAAGHDSVLSAFKRIDQRADQSGRKTQMLSNNSAKGYAALYREQRRMAIRNAREIAKVEKSAQQARLKQERTIAREAAKAARIQEKRREEVSTSRGISALGAGGVGLALGGISSIVNTIQDVLGKGFDLTKKAAFESISLQDRAIRLSISGGGKNRMDPTTIRQNATDIAADVKGVKAGDVIAGMQAFVTMTGNLGKADEFAKTLAEVSVGTGSSLEELGQVAASLFKNGAVKTADDLFGVLSMLSLQGKNASFELADMAKEMPEMLASAGSRGIKGVEGVADIGALAQLTQEVTNNAAESGTAVRQMLSQLSLKSSDIGSAAGMANMGAKGAKGVRVFEDTNKTIMRPMWDVLTEIIADAKGNSEVLKRIFDVRGERSVSYLAQAYNSGVQETQGTEAQKTAEGIKRMRQAIEKFRSSVGAEEEMRQDIAQAKTMTQASMDQAWESFVGKVGEGIGPELAKIIQELAPIVDEIDFGSVAKDMAELGSAVKDAAKWFGLFKSKDPVKDARVAGEKATKLKTQADRLGEKIAKGEGSPEDVEKYNSLIKESLQASKEKKIAEKMLMRGSEAEASLVSRAGLSESTARGITGRIYKNPTEGAGLSQFEGAMRFLELTGKAAINFNPYTMAKNVYEGKDAIFGSGLQNIQEELRIRSQLATDVKSDTNAVNAEFSTENANSKIDGFASAVEKAAGALSKISEVNLGSLLGL